MVQNSEAKYVEYLNLSNKIAKGGISALTAEQIRRLEELYQLSLNRELDPEAREEVLKYRAKERINTLKQRIERGDPPVSETFLQFWRWNSSRETYVWMGPTRPNDLSNGEFSWQPEWVNKPNPYGPEGTPQSRV